MQASSRTARTRPSSWRPRSNIRSSKNTCRCSPLPAPIQSITGLPTTASSIGRAKWDVSSSALPTRSQRTLLSAPLYASTPRPDMISPPTNTHSPFSPARKSSRILQTRSNTKKFYFWFNKFQWMDPWLCRKQSLPVCRQSALCRPCRPPSPLICSTFLPVVTTPSTTTSPDSSLLSGITASVLSSIQTS